MLVSLGILGLVLALAIGGSLWYLTQRWAGNIDRVADVFESLDEEVRPAPATPAQGGGEPITFLLVGSDTREEAEEGIAPGGRSDAIMLARFSADREHAQLVSIPRDSWVEIPGRGLNKINASYAFGGPSLLIQTVEQLTQVRIDHYVAIDFEGLIQVTDELGGVDVVVAETTTNEDFTFAEGANHLDGEQVRAYLAQRKNLPGGDFDRVKRQQQYLKAMFSKLFSADTFTNPGRLDSALRTVTDAVVIDDTLGNADLLQMAYSLRGLTPANVEFFTAPVLGTGMEGAASVVYLDATTGERMWEYLRNDSLAGNADEFSDESLPDVPR
ncbi:transcriptional attenuator, LytR family [Blastococcus aggregatus]|uniref:Transcriptional attenuator, LytR family n=1 Tax=Blastococcus aggregatus TaxID=38502 RepID=A0A285V5I0_9ACTN|nr:LCP family protein [Blastococcus aggregatus]SOC47751.1 transcriptional attenuator, LytR family [Blastococcus aggregatus]